MWAQWPAVIKMAEASGVYSQGAGGERGYVMVMCVIQSLVQVTWIKRRWGDVSRCGPGAAGHYSGLRGGGRGLGEVLLGSEGYGGDSLCS